MAFMTYEEYLDEVTTLMTEKFDMSDEAAIKHVMRAQANDFFTKHDDIPEMRTQERAEQDAQTIFDLKNKSRAHVAPKRGPAKPSARKSTTPPVTAVAAENAITPAPTAATPPATPPDSPYGKRPVKK